MVSCARGDLATASAPDGEKQFGSMFSELLDPAENVFRLGRSLSPSIATALDEVARGQPFDHRVILDAKTSDVSELLQSVSHPGARRFLHDDILWIVNGFFRAFECDHVVAQLSIVGSDSCRKFHVDLVTVRLLCTYAGPGTEWVRNQDIVRENLGKKDERGLAEVNRSLLRSEHVVHRCEPGDVLLLKGEAFPGNLGRGAVHRSPPIEERALRRLVLRLDERVMDPSA